MIRRKHVVENYTRNKKYGSIQTPLLYTHKKKWGEYLLEFFMLFVAVTLVFLLKSEEEIKHKEEVKTQISEMLSDLQTVISLFDQALTTTVSAQMGDYLIELLHSDILNTPDICYRQNSYCQRWIYIPTLNLLIK